MRPSRRRWARSCGPHRAVTPDDLPDLIFGLVIANDISARDVQLPQTQFSKGKSNRGFCPVGPYLTVPERIEFAVLDDLLLTLAVNGAVRQQASTANLVFKPAETLAELTTFSDLSPGDLILTGAAAPPDAVAARARAVEGVRERAAEAPVLSQAGDRMMLTIKSPDRRIDLGEQQTTVRDDSVREVAR
jgi:2-keto-4-pentenoate hydratase/2-oxohepta-3-ene-1,7-dioic acid hydratase in catechol pathway